MIVKKQKLYTKIVNRRSTFNYDRQHIRRNGWYLFGIIPLYVTHEILDAVFEN